MGQLCLLVTSIPCQCPWLAGVLDRYTQSMSTPQPHVCTNPQPPLDELPSQGCSLSRQYWLKTTCSRQRKSESQHLIKNIFPSLSVSLYLPSVHALEEIKSILSFFLCTAALCVPLARNASGCPCDLCQRVTAGIWHHSTSTSFSRRLWQCKPSGPSDLCHLGCAPGKQVSAGN